MSPVQSNPMSISLFISMQRRNQAVREYQESKDKARFQQLAQKLAQHLNNLAEVESTKIRWIWELIQNAKDVPNEFGKTRMRIQIRENKLIFAHNGDPFRVSDLESLVAQYSSKPQENKTNIETTGKYGTGFITTYILSRKVRIKGLLGLKTKEEMEEQERREKLKEEERVELSTESSLKGEPKPAKKVYKFETSEDEGLDLSSQHLTEVSNKQEGKMKNFEGNSLYQKFQIYLDRDYKDRDKELFRKLMETEQMLIENLMSNEPQPRWQRKETELNTQFIYQELDEAAFKMIDEAIIALKELFPYVILFNPKIYQIQMIDKRKGHRMKNFGLKRIEETQNGPINVFNVLHLEQGQENRTISLAYIEDEQTFSTIAVPIFIHPGNKLQVLQVNHNLPKIFKEFPLIGCNDTLFNFCFTSRKFYPNESRSDLLLRGIQGRSSDKANSNWNALKQIFRQAKILYRQLAETAQEGQQNHLIMACNNQFTSKEYENHQLSQVYKQIMEEILDSNFVEFKSGRRGSLRDVRYIHGKSSSQTKKISAQAYSSELNDAFAFLVGDNFVLPSKWHQKFYRNLMSSRKQWEGSLRYHDINLCLSYFKDIKFDNLKFLFQNTQNPKETAFKALQNLYALLQIHNPEYMVYSENSKESPSNSMFTLTNSLNFVGLNNYLSDMTSLKSYALMKKQKVPIAYEQVGRILHLKIQDVTIHDRLVPYFSNLKVFNKESMIKRFKESFIQSSCKEADSGETREKIIMLARFMKTLAIPSAAFQILEGLKNFEGIIQLKVSTKDDIKIPTADESHFVIFFETRVLMFINAVINKSQKLARLIDYYLNSKQEDKAISWLNKVYQLQRNLTKDAGLKDNFTFKIAFNQQSISLFSSNKAVFDGYLIERNLSLSKNFCLMNTLRVFCQIRHEKDWVKGNYPDQKDLKLFQTYRNIHNSLIITNNNYIKDTPIERLEDRILHESIQDKLPMGTLFEDKFSFIPKMYLNKALTKAEKISFLDYLDSLISQSYEKPATAFKLVPFQKVIDRMYYDYALETECIKKKEDREFLFHLLKNPDEIELLRQIKKLGKFEEVLSIVKKEKDNKVK